MATDKNTALAELMKQHLENLGGIFGLNMAESVGNALNYMSQNQCIVSLSVPGCIPQFGRPPTKDAIRTYSLAMIIEIGEFVQELDWKPWKDKPAIDKDKVADEFADILAFMGILVSYLDFLGISPEQLGDAYQKKSLINVQRFLGQHAPEYRRVAENNGSEEYKQGILFEEES